MDTPLISDDICTLLINNLKSIYFVYQGTNFKTMQTKLSKVFDPFQLSPLSKLTSMFWVSYVR